MGTDRRKPLDGALFLASQIVFIIFTVPAFIPKPAQVIALIVVGWYFYQVVFTQTTGDFNIDFGLGSSILIQYMVALNFAFLTSPEELKDLYDADQTTVTQRPLKKRIIWALKLCSNPRGIGWAHEPSHLPARPSPSTPRSTFVFSRISLATFFFLVIWGMSHFSAAYASAIMAENLITGAPLHQRALGVLVFGLGGVCMISGINVTISAGVVGCGLSSPERWPLLFGSPLRVWSIRRFWRRFWHQMVRRDFLVSTSFILGCIFPANYVGTTSYELARMYIVFCISGIVHLGGDTMATGKLSFKSFTFFMLQPFGITIEIIISYLWRRLQGDDDSNRQKTKRAQQKQQFGNNRRSFEEEPTAMWVRCVGSIWVMTWMVWTAAYMVDPLSLAHLLYSKREGPGDSKFNLS